MKDSILLVDGHNEYLKSLSEFFRKREFETAAFGDYDRAVKLVAKKKFDIAVVDYCIGAQDGSGLCKAIAAWHGNQTALIITSAKHSSAIELSVRAQAPAFFFVKPFPVENLYAVVLKILDARDKRLLRMRKPPSGGTKETPYGNAVRSA